MPLVARAPSNFFPETGVSLFPRTDDPSTIPPPNFPIFYFVKSRGSVKKKEKNYSYLSILLFSRILIDLCQERKKANNIPLFFIEIVFDRLKDRRRDFFYFHASSMRLLPLVIMGRGESKPPRRRYDCLTFRQLPHVSRQDVSVSVCHCAARVTSVRPVHLDSVRAASFTKTGAM